ncbi:MAG: NADH-quinone oxidoreductase subunit I, partial [Pedosphaera sp. Tous-C6FEB]
MDSQLAQYVPVLFLLLVALAIAGGILILSEIAGRFFNRKIAARTTQVKDIPYECGMLPIGSGGARFSVK